MENLLFCPDASPNFFGIFDTSIAPLLLFYSYIPIIVVSLIFGMYVFFKDKRSLRSKLVLAIAVSFSLWVLNIILQWIAVPVALVHFAWELTALFEVLIYIFSIYFAMVFVREKDITFLEKTLLSLPLAVVLLALPTSLNVQYFDYINCQSAVGPMWLVIYGFELFSPLFVVTYLFLSLQNKNRNKHHDSKISFALFGLSLFLLIFSLSNSLAEITQTYEINLIGPIGMVLFLGTLTYTVVRYKAFDIKLLGTQVLVVVLSALVGSQFFFIQTTTSRFLNGITFLLSIGFGILLIRSAKKLDKSNLDLANANVRLKELDAQKTEFISLATHQIRGPLGAIKGFASLALEGDYGPIPDNAKKPFEIIMHSAQALVVVVNDYLDVSRIEQGRMKYDFSDFDLKTLVKTVVDEFTPTLSGKPLTIEMVCDQSLDYPVHADMGKIKQVMGNLLDNSIKYTPEGHIRVALEKKDGKLLFSIKDTGVGIRAEVIPNLFAKFSRSPDASKTNIIGTGLGLFVARKMIEAHKGRIWAESEGQNKGAQFYVELEEKKP
jgi:signal transduction histidine kinase